MKKARKEIQHMASESSHSNEFWFTLSIEDFLSDRQKYENFLDFQREEVWPLGKQRQLIEGLLRGYHLPEFQIMKKGEDFAFIDGKQRDLTIVEFARDGFTTFKAKDNPPYGSVDPNKLYSQLQPQWQFAFTHSMLSFHVIGDMEEWMQADYYRWLQYHQPLFLPEKLWTYPSETKRQAVKLLEHPFWRNIYHGNQSRKRSFLGCYYIMLLEVTGFGENIYERRLREFASGSEDKSVNSALVEMIHKRLDRVNHVFHGIAIKDLKEVIPVYQAVTILEKADFDLENVEKGCLTDWYKTVQDKAISDHQKYKIVDILFKMTGVSYRNLFWDQQQASILEAVKPYWKGETKKEQKQSQSQDIDPQIVVNKQNGLCPLCDRVIEDVFGGKYSMQYKKGSSLTLENCAVVHNECHKRLIQAMPNLELATVNITSQVRKKE
jgi:hypothetical protein